MRFLMVFLVGCWSLVAQDAPTTPDLSLASSPLESTSDHLGGLRSYGPLNLNDVTGKVTVTLPPIGPSALLSIQPLVRTRLNEVPLDSVQPGDHLRDYFDALGTGGSIGWGHLMVIRPDEEDLTEYALPMTYYQHGSGGPISFKRDYLYQTRTSTPQTEQKRFSFQNTIDQHLRRLAWQKPNTGDVYAGDYAMLEPSGRRMTFRARIFPGLIGVPINRLYYPVRVEDPSGEWVNIFYRFDADGNQLATMSYMQDNHGRKLRFFYDGAGTLLTEVRLLKPSENPQTDLGQLLAQFYYAPNGLTGPGGVPLKSLHKVVDALGYVWRLDWNTINPAFRLDRVTLPSKGKIELGWERVQLNIGDYQNTGNPIRSQTSWRVTDVHLVSPSETRTYEYSWKTVPDGGTVLRDPLLECTILGPEGLIQVTRYDNMPTEFVPYLESGPYPRYHVFFPCAGYPVYRETSQYELKMEEQWTQEPVFLWSTTFQPPKSGFLTGGAAGNALSWSVRPSSYRVRKDGVWYETTYRYGFNHAVPDTFSGQVNTSILLPTEVEQSIQGGTVTFVRAFTYLNRVPTNSECHENPALTPYALGLTTGSTETFYPQPGSSELLSKTTTVFDPNLPFPTEITEWASAAQSVKTKRSYYQSGPNKGKLYREYVGTPEQGVTFEAYAYGQPTLVKKPLQPDTVLTPDERGNVLTQAEGSVVTTYHYDALDRVTKVERPLSQDARSDYSGANASTPFQIDYFGDSQDPRRKVRSGMDVWGRPEEKVRTVQSGLEVVDSVAYNGLGQAWSAALASGASRDVRLDVYGRNRFTEAYLEDGSLLERTTYAYSAAVDGSSEIIETLARDGGTSIKTTKMDFLGRLLEVSFNKNELGPGGGLDPDDYVGGGFTTFTHTYAPATWLTTTTIKPYGSTASARLEVRDLLGRLVSLTDPEMGGGSVTYTYNDRGLLYETTFSDGRKLQNLYDLAGRLQETRQRTATDPEQFDLVLSRNTYQPDFGYLETQTKQLSTPRTHSAIRFKNPDALGRPKNEEHEVAEPLSWSAGLSRSLQRRNQREEVWLWQWQPLTATGGLAVEYVAELRPLHGTRAALYFPDIRRLNPEEPLVSWTLDQAMVAQAIEAQLVGDPDLQVWRDEVQRGLLSQTVLDPNQQYRLRICALDSTPQRSIVSPWWGDLPDLLVDSLEVQHDGNRIHLDFRVFNAGSRPAEPTTTTVYVSPTPSLPADALPLAVFDTPLIDPGFARQHSAPDLEPDGNAYVIVMVDTEHRVAELNENNNHGRALLAYQGTMNLAKPDVVVEELHYAYVSVGSRYETYATYSVQNQNPLLSTAQDGQNSRGNGLTHLYYSPDNLISNDDHLLATPEFGVLGPNGREIQTTSLGMFNEGVPLHRTHLVADVNSGVHPQPVFDEGSNTYNNVATILLPQQTGQGPDLQVAQFVHQGVTGSAGQWRMALTFTLHNRGVWTAAPSQVGFSYSRDAQWDSSDQRIPLVDGGWTVAMDALQPGWDQRREGSAQLALPSQEGFLIVHADIDNEVVESDELNWRSQSFLGYADLALEGARYDAASGRYSFQVRNLGNLTAPANAVKTFVDFRDRFEPGRSIQLTSFAVPSLAPGQTTTSYSTASGWAPPVSNLDTYLFFVADPEGVVHERNETNNVAAPFRIPGTGQGGSKPDLVPNLWGFTKDIWPEPEPLVAADLELSRPVVETIGFYPYYAYGFHFRGSAASTPIQSQLEVIFSADKVYGSADDTRFLQTFPTLSSTLEMGMAMFIDPQPNKEYVRMRVTGNVSETRSTNNVVFTQQSLPNVMGVYSVSNQTPVGCGTSTVAVFMSRDNLPTVSSGDDLICLYLHTGFPFGGSSPGHMIAYDGTFMDTFKPLSGWSMKFVVDALDAVDESDETNNVLVVDPDPANYHGSYLAKGLPPLPDPGPGSLAESVWVDRSTAVTAVEAQGYQEVSPGLYDLSFRLVNASSQSIALKNLSLFVSPDLGLSQAKLLCSSMLVGDSTGSQAFPATVPALGKTATLRYRVRIPRSFLGSQYKVLVVANGKKSEETAINHLLFNGKDTRIFGIFEPGSARLSTAL